PGVAIPPSLRNIFKELNDDLGVPIPDNGCLLPWAREGVLLLNTALTVREGAADSHKGRGWETFTDAIIRRLNERTQPIVFILWGRNALAKEELISNTKNMILRAPHPSPLSASRGFFGCKHFSKTNTILRACGIAPIDWAIPNTGQMKEHP
ncbi:MAG: uracil-DNA glycosylase, partial [Clostridia bacterium]